MHITYRQLDCLKGFYSHCFVVFHDGQAPLFEHWAKTLDALAVPVHVQNLVADFALDKTTRDCYLAVLLRQNGVTVVEKEVAA